MLPAGPAAASRGSPQPGPSSGVEELPEHEVAGIALVGGDVDARTRQEFVLAPARELAVVAHARDREQHVSLRLVGVTRRDQRLDERDHFLHVVGGARLVVGWQVAEGGHVVVIGLDRALGQRAGWARCCRARLC